MGLSKEGIEEANRFYDAIIAQQKWEREREGKTIEWLITLSDEEFKAFCEKVKRVKKEKEEKEKKETIEEYKKVMKKMKKLNLKP